MNGDKEVDIIDVILCLRQAIEIDEKNFVFSDINSDGEIDIIDVILILRKAIGL
ncbi:MAG: dockerin type I domain-containing protein [Candidatus Omnitrophica bacterium]|nr:dockerin type I domain-containing protein [Candidatus Omnitrophota bacterium]